MPSQEVNQFSVIIIVQVDIKVLGLIVDSVADVIFIKEEDMQDTSEMAVQVDTKFIKGVAKTKNEMVILLDIDYLLSKDEFDSLINNEE